ncbi:MAG TPA: caspase family protein [Pyrinomonadaceae bacterium]|jgi:hypothetical protein|nr:caspase family protein [Pyrinomonadaceae bacterium]
MVKRALLVGIDKYQYVRPLTGCVADARAMLTLLERNADGTPNYDCNLLVCEAGNPKRGDGLTKQRLREACRRLFSEPGEVVFYFSGHGALTETGGYLATSEAQHDDWGIPMQDIIKYANDSKAPDILIILDCCYSGDLGNPPVLNQPYGNPLALLRENVTVIAASRDYQSAMEAGGHGLFTSTVLEALDGGAADHMGWVTAPSIYSYVERRFNGWQQRPVYKTHATGLTVVRQCAPLIERLKLHQLVKYFKDPDFKYRLDPEYEPEDEHGKVHKPVNKEKVKIARLFKEYRDAGLLKATKPGEQFYWAARRRHTIELTVRGREYWRLVTDKRI